eukprot:300935-Rhodomonas_salina.1
MRSGRIGRYPTSVPRQLPARAFSSQVIHQPRQADLDPLGAILSALRPLAALPEVDARVDQRADDRSPQRPALRPPAVLEPTLFAVHALPQPHVEVALPRPLSHWHSHP